jgi:hypothetical protein
VKNQKIREDINFVNLVHDDQKLRGNGKISVDTEVPEYGITKVYKKMEMLAVTAKNAIVCHKFSKSNKLTNTKTQMIVSKGHEESSQAIWNAWYINCKSDKKS